MATREYTVPVGTDLIDAQGNGWRIAGIQIDNPSGSWLRVDGVNQSVPPYTLGWSMPLLPIQWNVTVRFTDSPSGTPSDPVGPPVTIRLSDTPVPASPGFPSGAAQSQSPIGSRIQILPTNVTFSLGPSNVIPPGTEQQNIVPIRVAVTWALVPVAGAPLIRPYGVVQCWIRTIDTTGFFGLGVVPIELSPEQPFVDYTFTPGYFLEPGFGLQAELFLSPGVGDAMLTVITQYYIQEAS